MAFRTRLLGLDDDLLDNLPSVADSVRDITGTVRSGLADAVTPDAPEPVREAPPTPIDPWEDAPGIAGATPAPLTAAAPTITPRTAESDQRAYGMNFVHEPIRSSPTMDHPIPLGDTQDDPWAGEPLAGLDVNAQPDTAPQNKGLPGLAGFDPFGTTADESKALERAGTFDRRMGIARGAMQLLGGLGGIVGGATGVQGIGAVGQGLSAGGSAPIDSMRDTVQGRITQRQAQDMRRMQYGQAQEDREAQQLRQQTQDDFRRQELEATVGLRQAQTEQARVRSQQMQDEWSQVSGNRTAAIQWLRTLAGQYPNAPIAQEVMAGTNEGGPLWNASLDQLSDYARQFSTLASSGQVAGRAGIGSAPGGGGGRPSAPLPPGPDGRPQPPPDLSAARRIIWQDAMNQGTDPDAALEVYDQSNASTQAAMFTSARGRVENREQGRFVLAEGLDPRQFANLSQDLDQARGAYSQFRNVSNSIDGMVRRYGENQVRLALQGDPRLAQVMGSEIGQLRGAVTRAVAEYRRAMTGSAASEQEDARIMSSLSMGSIANSPSATAAALMGTGQEMMNRALSSAPPDYVSEWQRRNREALQARRTRR